MDQDTAPSETGYDSLVSISPSLLDVLITRRAGLNFSALTDAYNLPYNEQTKACEALNHVFSQTIDGGDLYYEPELEQGYVAELLKEGGRVLDIGCGVEGLWVQAMATRFPKAEIIGVDLNPVELDWAPPNASFNVLDVNNGFDCFRNEHFDVVHVRFTAAWICIDARQAGIRRILKPGGVLLLEENRNELVREDDSVAVPTWIFTREGFEPYETIFNNLAEMIAANHSFPDDEEDVGEFVDVQEKVLKIHLGIRSDLPEHLQLQRAGKYLREGLMGYFKLPHIEDDGTVAGRERLLRLAKAFPERDSGLFQVYKLIFARKGLGGGNGTFLSNDERANERVSKKIERR